MNKKTPVYVISGFLGSGKTTILKKMVEDARKQNKKVGLILNELGDVNVEQHMFQEEQMVELLNGCICCSIQEDLKGTLKQFIDLPVDLLLIEGTGVANPNEIVDTLISIDFQDHFELMSIISLIDAGNFLDYQSIFSSSKEIRQLLKEQIMSATLLIINKSDLVTPKKLDKVEAAINKLAAANTKLLKSSYGDVPVTELYLKRVQTVNASQPTSCSCNHDHNEDCNHKDHVHAHHASIKAVKILDLPTFNKQEFQRWFKRLPADIIRGKGIIKVQGEEGFINFQYAAGRLSFEKISSTGPVETIMILIGNQINKDEVLDYYEKTFLQEKEVETKS
ncbi:CobW family GTP-binding protein [Bacillus sp. AK128]